MVTRSILGGTVLATLLGACTTAQVERICVDDLPDDRGARVQTAFGPVEGYEDDGVLSYRGIPYAAPPIDELRWKPPIDPEPWTDTLLRPRSPTSARSSRLRAFPSPGFMPSEDCLYLNVDTPARGFGLPVMVVDPRRRLHAWRGLADGRRHGGRLDRAEVGTVVVSMNYRLGQLGFLAHAELTAESPDGASGNYGLMDQTAALEWVQGQHRALRRRSGQRHDLRRVRGRVQRLQSSCLSEERWAL